MKLSGTGGSGRRPCLTGSPSQLWERRSLPLPHFISGSADTAPEVKGDAIKKTISILLVAGLALIGSSMATILAEPAKSVQTRRITAGRATLQIPIHMPKEIIRGTVVSGSAILGSKDDCDITYDQYMAIHWSDRPVKSKELLPTDAYKKVAEIPGPPLDFGKDKQARVRNIHLSAEKPCGKIVKENLKVIEMYCAQSKTHIAIVGMLNPVVTQEKVVEIAKSLQCP
jgi:hypothetical protein